MASKEDYLQESRQDQRANERPDLLFFSFQIVTSRRKMFDPYPNPKISVIKIILATQFKIINPNLPEFVYLMCSATKEV